jgi:hypothetical protein
LLVSTDADDDARLAVDRHRWWTAAGVPVRTLALAPGRLGGLDHVVPVLAPSVRSWSLRGVLRHEVAWAEVVVLVGPAADRRRSLRLGPEGPPIVVDDGLGARVVEPAPVVTPAERTAARRILGLDDEPAWLLVHDARDRSAARSVRLGLPGAVRLDLDDRNSTEIVVAAADVVVAPVASAAVPLDLLAGGVRGLPMVALDTPAVRPYVDRTTGSCVPARSGVLASAVAEVAADPVRRAAMGAAAADRVRSVADPAPWWGAWLQRCTSAIP